MENRPFGGRRARFPAYDDETGVKLNKSSQRVLFDGNDDFLTDYKLDAKDVLERATRHNKRSRRVHLDEKPREELVRHRGNLPTYETMASEQKRAPRRLFAESKTVAEDKRVSFHEKHRNGTPFKPKHVPESLIPDEPKDAIPLQELYTTLRESKKSYLLFDTGNKGYQPSIQTNKAKQAQSSRLDRSLQGIMTDNNQELETSKYFNE
ncbi:hypothetical protein JZO70_11590 [Enterococcus sp. 669A]|uniref:Uncharacterized protein n=1 Tax=Candidatus Enterococcus moelleringii TaxID=2815325 RepID=A0ABS3LCK7_9ENTE|nr:hypothetical protein [Enterococcus sp. 669A]MBO1306810.1 hypothetical protein [Enterococcus sp. 669A]